MKNLLTQEELDYIENLCYEYELDNFTINSSGLVDVSGDVWLHDAHISQFPIKFGKVSGDFVCSLNDLTTLFGAPHSVGGNFECNYNNLTTLEYCPSVIGGDFNCNGNSLTTLEYCPTTIGNQFFCESNKFPAGFMEVLVSLYPSEYDDYDPDEHIDAEIDCTDVLLFLKYQNGYEVWVPKFSLENVQGLVDDIKDGLK